MNRNSLVKYDESKQTGSSVVSNPDKLILALGNFSWIRIDEAISKTIESRMKEDFVIQAKIK